MLSRGMVRSRSDTGTQVREQTGKIGDCLYNRQEVEPVWKLPCVEQEKLVSVAGDLSGAVTITDL